MKPIEWKSIPAKHIRLEEGQIVKIDDKLYAEKKGGKIILYFS